ncbi:hypothetical protein NQ317_018531 [Molorchus minor]|uniref:Uncharacterized protein n=1 Tax=Molorchus minor TaxID=1323400 RepID=A0ABQ9IW49_9CUCU|nr:hypothetical protein NQ317_018531 [Molorchus minor]
MENTSAENIYERISSDSYVIYDIPGPSGDELLRKSREENLNRPSTILLENETYTTTPRRRENKENPNRATSFLLENDQYRSTDKINVADTDSNEQELIDHNENFMCSNDQDKTTGEENAYSIIQLYDSVKNVGNDPNEYEYLNTYAELEPNAEENLLDNHNKNEKGKKKKKQKKRQN